MSMSHAIQLPSSPPLVSSVPLGHALAYECNHTQTLQYAFISYSFLSYTQVPDYIKMNRAFTVTLTTAYPTPAGLRATDRFRVVLANPGFSTHSERHGMRNVVLPVTAAKVAPGAGGTYTATLSVVGPPSGNIAPAGFYWLHVTDQGGMQVEGKWVGGYWVPNAEGVAVQLHR